MTAIVWFRHDLRLSDNPALSHALAQHDDILPLYILDETHTRPLGGASRWWLYHSLQALGEDIRQLGGQLCLRRGDPLCIFAELLELETIKAVYWNRVYEPASIKRDTQLKSWLKTQALTVKSFNGALLADPTQINTKQGGVFKVFTPFSRALREHLPAQFKPSPAPAQLPQKNRSKSDNLADWQLLPTQPNWAQGFTQWQPGEQGADRCLHQFITQHLDDYANYRDRPDKPSTSTLSPHLHFGEISPQQVWQAIAPLAHLQPALSKSAEMILRQLIWRDFSYYLLYHFPHLPTDNFRPQFDQFPWQHDEQHLQAWQRGQTGFPLVDAGMRQLWQTGYMHNRVRMIVASFLCKDLLIHWHYGEAWFWDTLVDADLANNSASWQWVAGSGADAAPYFRVFNPTLQSQKFDPQGDYIRRYVPELAHLDHKAIHDPFATTLSTNATLDYPKPIVDHKQARQQALAAYETVKQAD